MADVDAPDNRSKKLRRLVLVLTPAVAFIALLTYGLIRSAPSKVTAGSEIPPFELPRLDGAGSMTQADLRGSAVVINFWASWCIPCREEAELLERTYREYRDRGVLFVGVNIKDSDDDALRFVEEYGVSYPILRDVDEELAGALGVSGIPETFFIDADGRFVGTASGAARGETQGTVVLGPVVEEELVTNIEILLRRGGSAGR